MVRVVYTETVTSLQSSARTNQKWDTPPEVIMYSFVYLQHVFDLGPYTAVYLMDSFNDERGHLPGTTLDDDRVWIESVDCEQFM